MLGTSRALTVCYLIIAATVPTVSAAADQDPVIVIRIESRASVDSENLRRAQSLVTDIYAQAGVALQWTSVPAAQNADTLTIVLTTTEAAPRGIAREAMGVSPSPGDGTRGTRAYIFLDKVTAFTSAHKVASGYVLGCAIAHELGHLLLPPNSHQADGIMQGNWHPGLFPPHAPGVPGFPPAQARLLRARAQGRQQASPSSNFNGAPGQDAPATVLVVCTTTSPELSVDDRERSVMFAEAQTIWQPHGVAIRQGESGNCDWLVRVKSGTEAGPEEVADQSALAWVPFVAGRARRLVFLRAPQVRSLVGELSPGSRPAALTQLLAARLLGRILAHELGHMLLNSAQHQPDGLMRTHYHAREVLSAPVSTYTLGAGERALFFAATGKEIRVALR